MINKMLYKVMKRELKLANAQNDLAVMYYEGKVVDCNVTKAIQLMIKAADHGSPEAQYNLAKLYYDGIRVKQDYTVALQWAKKAITNENSDRPTICFGRMLKDKIESYLNIGKK